jgi:hypothetical protein
MGTVQYMQASLTIPDIKYPNFAHDDLRREIGNISTRLIIFSECRKEDPDGSYTLSGLRFIERLFLQGNV